ncbi:hypothetical protein VTI74DRAFT_5260 [Chaetomium olivicolor]
MATGSSLSYCVDHSDTGDVLPLNNEQAADSPRAPIPTMDNAATGKMSSTLVPPTREDVKLASATRMSHSPKATPSELPGQPRASASLDIAGDDATPRLHPLDTLLSAATLLAGNSAQSSVSQMPLAKNRASDVSNQPRQGQRRGVARKRRARKQRPVKRARANHSHGLYWDIVNLRDPKKGKDGVLEFTAEWAPSKVSLFDIRGWDAFQQCRDLVVDIYGKEEWEAQLARVRANGGSRTFSAES